MKPYEAHELFNKNFGISLLRFIDGNLCAIYNMPKIDIMKFEDWLREQHPDDKSLSMASIITKNYGSDICEKIKELI